jgi:hypothetical protein
MVATIGVDEGFVAYCRGAQGFAAEVGQFMVDLVMPKYDETTYLALKCMSNGELTAASVAESRYIWRLSCVLDEELVTKLLRRDFRSVDRGRHDREPRSSFHAGLQVLTGVTRERGKDAGELFAMALDFARP